MDLRSSSSDLRGSKTGFRRALGGGTCEQLTSYFRAAHEPLSNKLSSSQALQSCLQATSNLLAEQASEQLTSCFQAPYELFSSLRAVSKQLTCCFQAAHKLLSCLPNKLPSDFRLPSQQPLRGCVRTTSSSWPFCEPPRTGATTQPPLVLSSSFEPGGQIGASQRPTSCRANPPQHGQCGEK